MGIIARGLHAPTLHTRPPAPKPRLLRLLSCISAVDHVSSPHPAEGSTRDLRLGLRAASAGTWVGFGFPATPGHMLGSTAMILKTCATCSSGGGLPAVLLSSVRASAVGWRDFRMSRAAGFAAAHGRLMPELLPCPGKTRRRGKGPMPRASHEACLVAPPPPSQVQALRITTLPIVSPRRCSPPASCLSRAPLPPPTEASCRAQSR